MVIDLLPVVFTFFSTTVYILFMPSKSAPNGFTLVELLTVIVIIATISSIGLVIFSNSQKIARDNKRIQDAISIQNALEQYYALNGNYPYLGTPNTKAMNTAGASFLRTAIDPLFSTGSIPYEPGNMPQYRYSYGDNSACKRYIVCVALENCSNNKCNRLNWPVDGCDVPTTPGNPSNNRYCVDSQSE